MADDFRPGEEDRIATQEYAEPARPGRKTSPSAITAEAFARISRTRMEPVSTINWNERAKR